MPWDTFGIFESDVHWGVFNRTRPKDFESTVNKSTLLFHKNTPWYDTYVTYCMYRDMRLFWSTVNYFSFDSTFKILRTRPTKDTLLNHPRKHSKSFDYYFFTLLNLNLAIIITGKIENSLHFSISRIFLRHVMRTTIEILGLYAAIQTETIKSSKVVNKQ